MQEPRPLRPGLLGAILLPLLLLLLLFLRLVAILQVQNHTGVFGRAPVTSGAVNVVRSELGDLDVTPGYWAESAAC